jgi:UDP-glucose 4-epimerase
LLDTDIEPIYEKERAGDIKHSVADISKAKSFGFAPKNDFKEELKETIEWFKDNL